MARNKNTKKENIQLPSEEIVEEIEEAALGQTETKQNIVAGVVVDCPKLNIRKDADINSKVLSVVPASSELTIDLNKSADDWYSVRTKVGIKGFCMKKYIKVES